MLRSAAKNHDSVTVVVDPLDYAEVAKQIKATGNTTLELRRNLAAKVFARTAAYDAAIAAHLQNEFKVEQPSSRLTQAMPAPLFHIRAAGTTVAIRRKSPPTGGALRQVPRIFPAASRQGTFLQQHSGFDGGGGFDCRIRRGPPTLAILKHMNPCGVGQGASLREAWDKAFATDKQAPFGGIIAVNRTVDGACADAIAEIFSEVIVAPDFSPEALAILQKKKNLRLLKSLKSPLTAQSWDVRSVGADSFLLQERDMKATTAADLKMVTRRRPSEMELNAMLFGWRIVKHVKSNAIVYVADDRTLGIGAGQMSRVDASRIAVWKAGEAGLSLKDSVVCSDAFFPFPDGLIAAAEAGATAVIQPGGSVRDAEVIAAADERKVAMAFTGVRHFRH